MKAPTQNILDKAIAWLNPVAGAKRMQARLAVSMAQRAYEGASISRRTAGWHTADTSANAEISCANARLRQRARDLVRNNTYAAKGVQVISANLVGAGIMARPKATSPEVQKRVAAAWAEWADSINCDYEGRKNFYGIQRLLARSTPEAGEVLIRRRFTKRRLELQILEADFLDTNKDGQVFSNGNHIIQGIEFSSTGKRVAYWLYTAHPGDTRNYGKSSKSESIRVDAIDIIHLYREDRPGQVRGVSWFAPCMIRLRDFDEYEDAQLVRQKIAAAFVGFVKDISGPETSTGLGSGKPGTPEKIEPGAFEILPPGKEVQFSNPPGVDGYKDFSDISLHAIAAGLGVTYESLTGDLRGVNYSSGRMGWLEFNRNVEEWQWNIFIPHFCQTVWQWFSEWQELLTGTQPVPVAWTPPRRAMIDPDKEFSAMNNAIRNGLSSQSEALRSLGYEPQEVIEEWENDAKLWDKKKLVFDCDPRTVMKAGIKQADVVSDNQKQEQDAGKTDAE